MLYYDYQIQDDAFIIIYIFHKWIHHTLDPSRTCSVEVGGKTKTRLSYKVHIIAADGLATKGGKMDRVITALDCIICMFRMINLERQLGENMMGNWGFVNTPLCVNDAVTSH